MPYLTHEELAKLRRESYNLGYNEGYKEGKLTGYDEGYCFAMKED